MTNNKINQLLKDFNNKTNSKGCILIDVQGLIIYSDRTNNTNSDEELERIAALIAVESSITSKISMNVTRKEVETSVIINDEDYIIIKGLNSDNTLLSHHKRDNNLDALYEEVKELSKNINNSL